MYQSGTSFEVLVLAGGKSSRFGSDKCIQPIMGESALNRLCNYFPCTVLAKVERGLDGCVETLEPPYVSGPVESLSWVVERLSSQRIFITACDVPLMSPRLPEYMCGKGYEAVLLDNGESIQPFPGCYERASLKRSLETSRTMQDVVRSVREVYVMGKQEISFVDPSMWSLMNVNTWQDIFRRPTRVPYISRLLIRSN